MVGGGAWSNDVPYYYCIIINSLNPAQVAGFFISSLRPLKGEPGKSKIIKNRLTIEAVKIFLKQ